MHPNPILDELYLAREKLLADAGGDVHRFLEGVRQREQGSGRLVATDSQNRESSNSAESIVDTLVEHTPAPE